MKKSLITLIALVACNTALPSQMTVSPEIAPTVVSIPAPVQYQPRSAQALSGLSSAIKTDASHYAHVAQKTTQGWYQATKQTCLNTHKIAQNCTISFGNGVSSIGEWIKSHPNVTMTVAAALAIGYSVYKIRQIYQTYKNGTHVAQVQIKIVPKK